MATLGLCAYCERIADRTCTMCGKTVCEAHTADHGSVCTVCSRGGSIDEDATDQNA